jgi:hypothetical protein
MLHSSTSPSFPKVTCSLTRNVPYSYILHFMQIVPTVLKHLRMVLQYCTVLQGNLYDQMSEKPLEISLL